MAPESLSDSLQETLGLFDRAGTPQTTREITQQLDIGRRSTYNRLQQLVDAGRVETKKVGGNGRVWWQPLDATVPETRDWERATDSLIDVLDGADVGVLVCDENSDVVWLNEATERYFDIDQEAAVGRDHHRLIEDVVADKIENSNRFVDTVRSNNGAMAPTDRFECKVRAAPDRAPRWLEHHTQSIETGAFAGCRVDLFEDITARKQSEREWRAERQQFDQLVDAVEEYAIFMLDPDGRIKSWNAGAEQIKGYSAEEIIGEHFSTFYTAEDCQAETPEQNLAAAESKGSIKEEGWRVRKDGSRFWASVTITAIQDDDDAIEGYIKVTHDLTDRRAYERALEEQTERLGRQRDTLENELDGIFERIDDTVYALNENLEFEFVNESAARRFGKRPGDFLGKHVSEVLEVDDALLETFESAMATQEQRTHEWFSEQLGLWAAIKIYPSESGLSVYFRDITEQKRYERKLQQYQHTVETIWDGVVILDADNRFVMVNEAFCEISGYEREELVGESITSILGDINEDDAEMLDAELSAGNREFATLEYEIERPDGDTVTVEGRFGPYELEDGTTGRTGVARDISERIEYERELEESERRYRTLVENFPDGSVCLFDDDLCYTIAGGELIDTVCAHPDGHVGKHISEIHPEELVDRIEPHFEDALAGNTHSFDVEYHGHNLNFKTVPVRDADGAVFAGMVVVRDRTDQVKRQQKIEASEQRYRTLIENFPNGAVTLVDEELRYLTVGGEPVDEADTTSKELEGRRLQESLPPEILDIVLPHYRAALDGESRELVQEIGSRSYQFYFIPVRDSDGTVSGAMGMSQDITRDKERQQELVQQRKQLAALNNLNDTVREITDAVITQSTRDEIESIVCERLAATDSYEFAWIGDVDAASQTVKLRTEAGVEGYLDGVTISVDPDDERSMGPTGRAIRSEQIQTTQEVSTDTRHDPWRDHLEQYSFQSSAAIPLVHEGSVYGVLNVYADRPNGFEGQERAVISQIGEIVGHAIAATERKRALMSDEVIELQFQVQNLFQALGIDGTPAGTIQIDHAVPIESNEFLVYGTATPDAVESMEAIVAAVPHWEEVTYKGGTDETSFELRLTDPPVLSTVAGLGGSVESVVIEDGDGLITIHVTPTTDPRRVIETVEEAYPTAEMVKRHQTTRPSTAERQREFMADLTDRQRTCLETAIYTGFFEWPRDGSAAELAETIGISAPTFHQHLRKAQKTVFESLFPTPVTDSA